MAQEAEAYGDAIVEALRRPSVLVAPHLLVLLGERADHGYALAHRLADLGFPGAAKSVYRELRRMEDAGLLRSAWIPAQTQGPARRVYELTDRGREVLAACRNAARQLEHTLGDFSSRFRSIVDGPPTSAGTSDA